ncbi:hypothetical protein B4168_4039 [Anoxybacillus flavithermus]|nr:hypothetical protein B4168_4039 [Anoxybacillus flavithermus]OAO87582.1 hypothetical protein GT23_1231 [Parageobacillus thermoglucosidasius]
MSKNPIGNVGVHNIFTFFLSHVTKITVISIFLDYHSEKVRNEQFVN